MAPGQPQSGQPEPAGLHGATLCVTRVELNNRTGGGVILAQILDREPALAVIYSLRLFDGDCIGDLAIHLNQHTENLAQATAAVVAALDSHEVARIVCAPQDTSDALSAVAAADFTGAPLATYFMDDSNVFREGISDAAMQLLVERSAICFAISPLLCDVYERKFGGRFWLLPPVNEARLFAPPGFEPANNIEPRGVIIGNVWSTDVLDDLRETVGGAGLQVDWYGNAGRPFLDPDPDDLARDGIAIHPNLADAPLIRELRACDYAIMPSRALCATNPHDHLYRASLPSRLVYLFTTAHLPIIVLGDTATTAGQFVTSFGLGVVAPYDPGVFAEAVRRLTSRTQSEAIRSRAARLSRSFAAEPVADWIWRSAAIGHPIYDRYERLFAEAGFRR